MEKVETPWASSADEVREAMDADVDGGLSGSDVQRRRERFGPNRLEAKERRGVLEILWNQLESLIVLLLAVAGGVSLAFGQTAEAGAIAVVLVVNTAIGFWMELRAVRSMESLREMGQAKARVRREGSTETVGARELVPGDIVILREGDVVTADLRLLEVDGLQVDESSLTGESVPVDKETEALSQKTPLADRTCMAYRGTTIRRGSGVGVVVDTGMDTELGAISAMVDEEEEDSPLDRRLDRLGRKLVWLTVGVAAVVTATGILAGRDVFTMVETGIALAVAAIPEGLTIVATVALARGMRRMMKRQALLRRLDAVETLGSATMICADKTGTLTRNEMTVRRLATTAGDVSLESQEGGTSVVESGEDPSDPESPFHDLFVAATLASEADPDEDEGGEPMDLALVRLARDLGMPVDELRKDRPHVRTWSFDTETQMMATLQESGDGYLLAVKGAPEAVLEASARTTGENGEDGPMDDAARDGWRERMETLAGEGLRVLAVADRTMDDADAEPYEDLRFLGLLGFYDPPREDVAPAIARCQAAGIRVIMATGDHRETARQIAREVGLGPADGEELEVAEGDALESLENDPEKARRTARIDVFARVDPEQKLRLIDLQQEQGEILAMTGDGVNDAPALRSADIGVAMGKRGTDVAREASDMVLLDDAFASIVEAVALGRAIFRNMRKFVIYLLSGNVGEIVAVGAATAAGLPLPLLPLQILYLNLVNDVFPALALGLGPGSPRLMEQPPRDPEEGILESRHWWVTVGFGLMISVVVLGAFVLAMSGLGMSHAQAVTVVFLGLSGGRLLHVFNMRDVDSPLLRNEVTRNPWVWGALVVCVSLLAVAVLVAPLADLLGLVRPNRLELLLAGGTSVAVLVLGQIALIIGKLRG